MLRLAIRSFVALTLITASATPALAIPDGLYFTLGIGGATVSGDRGIALKAESIEGNATLVGLSDQARDELIRTDFGSGLAVQLKIGYQIAGYASIEAYLSGYGSPPFDDGMGHVGGQIKFHPAVFYQPLKERKWDADIYGGFGYSLGGYKPDPAIQGNDDSKGWEGLNGTFGLSGRYQVAKGFTIGIDLKLIFPLLDTWIFDWDDNIEFAVQDTPSGLVFTPTLTFNFHVM